MSSFRAKFKKDIPKDFSEETVKTIERITSNHQVIGVLFLRAGALELYTVPEITAQGLASKLPLLNNAMRQAVTELDIQNELVAYRIEANSFEITVVTGPEFCACVLHKLKKRRKKKPQLQETKN